MSKIYSSLIASLFRAELEKHKVLTSKGLRLFLLN